MYNEVKMLKCESYTSLEFVERLMLKLVKKVKKLSSEHICLIQYLNLMKLYNISLENTHKGDCFLTLLKFILVINCETKLL